MDTAEAIRGYSADAGGGAAVVGDGEVAGYIRAAPIGVGRDQGWHGIRPHGEAMEAAISVEHIAAGSVGKQPDLFCDRPSRPIGEAMRRWGAPKGMDSTPPVEGVSLDIEDGGAWQQCNVSRDIPPEVGCGWLDGHRPKWVETAVAVEHQAAAVGGREDGGARDPPAGPVRASADRGGPAIGMHATEAVQRVDAVEIGVPVLRVRALAVGVVDRVRYHALVRKRPRGDGQQGATEQLHAYAGADPG